MFAFGLSMILTLGIEFLVRFNEKIFSSIFFETVGRIGIKTNARFHISNFYRLASKDIFADITQGEVTDDKLRKTISERILSQGTEKDVEKIERVTLVFLRDPVTMEILSSAMKKD